MLRNHVLVTRLRSQTGLVAACLYAALLAFAPVALGTSPRDQPARSDSTEEFVRRVATHGWTNREAAALALTSSANPAVKDFAQRMIYDQTRLDEHLAQVARRRQVAIPSQADATRTEILNRLRQQNGASFDEGYARLIRQDRQELADLLLLNLLNADTEVAVYASYFMPLIQHQARLARQLPAPDPPLDDSRR